MYLVQGRLKREGPAQKMKKKIDNLRQSMVSFLGRRERGKLFMRV